MNDDKIDKIRKLKSRLLNARRKRQWFLCFYLEKEIEKLDN